jgi:predicted outer membrane lipoprotein
VLGVPWAAVFGVLTYLARRFLGAGASLPGFPVTAGDRGGRREHA